MGDSVGRLYRFNLIDGTLHQFFQMPGEPMIAATLFSVDHSKIAIQSRTRGKDGINVDKYVWDLFDYAKLQKPECRCPHKGAKDEYPNAGRAGDQGVDRDLSRQHDPHGHVTSDFLP